MIAASALVTLVASARASIRWACGLSSRRGAGISAWCARSAGARTAAAGVVVFVLVIAVMVVTTIWEVSVGFVLLVLLLHFFVIIFIADQQIITDAPLARHRP
jgi:hypothetical protein